MVMSTYTWSRFREKVAPLNPWEDSRSASVPATDRIA